MVNIYTLTPQNDENTEIKMAPSTSGLMIKIQNEDNEAETKLTRQEAIDLGMTILNLTFDSNIVISERQENHTNDKVNWATLGLSVRCRRVFHKLGIETLGDLASSTTEQLLACRDFGQMCLREVRVLLQDYELGLRGEPYKPSDECIIKKGELKC